ncbi:MAG: IS701 family transposase [Halobacteriales archaeon]|nr:IS701 family transposase [Halobacteriales archaeon]
MLAGAAGHADRAEPLRAYVTGLCLPGDRKSIEPLAARIEPRRVGARHQSMHHLVANAPWQDAEVLRVARQAVVGQMERHGAIAAWVVDDTGIPKKGTHSVGVARQWCGVLGKQDNCQVAVSVSLANEAVSIPAAYRLYLPEEWNDEKRRRKAGVPEEVRPATKLEIALKQVQALQAEGVPLAPVVADAAYGSSEAFRDQLVAWGIPYVLAVREHLTVLIGPTQWVSAARTGQRGRPRTRGRWQAESSPIALAELALQLPTKAWGTVSWREGTAGTLQSSFAFMRVHTARTRARNPGPEEWLIIERPPNQPGLTKFYLSSMPAATPHEQLVRIAKIRWRIERDYQELKDEFGLDHFEGRNWRGFHHHATLAIAAYGFVASERARLSPPEPIAFLRAAKAPPGFRPRGAARATRAA